MLFNNPGGNPADLINLRAAFNSQRGQINEENVLSAIENKAILKLHFDSRAKWQSENLAGTLSFVLAFRPVPGNLGETLAPCRHGDNRSRAASTSPVQASSAMLKSLAIVIGITHSLLRLPSARRTSSKK